MWPSSCFSCSGLWGRRGKADGGPDSGYPNGCAGSPRLASAARVDVGNSGWGGTRPTSSVYTTLPNQVRAGRRESEG